MGQKIHPTGLRLGINKEHDATWFANYGTYKQTLEEDHKIRKFIEKDWETIYSKAGITKLEIKLAVNTELDKIFNEVEKKCSII